jgi:hypothetical protein
MGMKRYRHIRKSLHQRARGRMVMEDAFQRNDKETPKTNQLSYDGYLDVRQRRDRLFGLWVAEQLGKHGTAAEGYAADIVAENFDNSGDIYMLHRVRTDLREAGIAIGMPDILAQLSRAETTARREVFQPM